MFGRFASGTHSNDLWSYWSNVTTLSIEAQITLLAATSGSYLKPFSYCFDLRLYSQCVQCTVYSGRLCVKLEQSNKYSIIQLKVQSIELSAVKSTVNYMYTVNCTLQ